MPTREQWIRALRESKGIRFHHQGRSDIRDGGLDCVGLLIQAGIKLGIESDSHKITDYAATPDKSDFDYWCKKYLTPKPYKSALRFSDQAQPGDIITFWVNRVGQPRHIAVYTDQRDGRPWMIHSDAGQNGRGVVEEPMPTFYVPRVHGLWSLPEFEDK